MSAITETETQSVKPSSESKIGFQVPSESNTGISDSFYIPKSMKAATVVEVCLSDVYLSANSNADLISQFNAPLQLLDNIPVPSPTGSDILVKITASALCQSDLAGISGGLGPAYPVPYCAGHEPVGVVVAVPESMSTGFAVGDRVGFMAASSTCQDCRSCLSGNHRFCARKTSIGFQRSYGGFSEFSLADPLSTVKVPPEITDEEAAPLLCAGVTAYAAVKKIAAFQTGGTLISVVGCGGVGHLVVQYAKKMGFDVQACRSLQKPPHS